VHEKLVKSGVIEEPEYYMNKPVKKSNGDIEEYDRQKVYDDIVGCGVPEENAAYDANSITDLVEDQLEDLFGLGKRVVFTRYIRHVIYKTLLNKKYHEEALNYKKDSGKNKEDDLDKELEEKFPYTDMLKHSGRRNISLKKAVKSLLGRDHSPKEGDEEEIESLP